ncbi:MAG: PAS domain S-box protein, partial [Bacteroidota bacterium]|nr:PAS domain S-box protein [Bacteroidota bacterium]
MPELIFKNLMMDKQILLGILMGTSHSILILDKESSIISVSQKAKDTLGYMEVELAGKKITDVIEQSYHSSLLSILNFIYT